MGTFRQISNDGGSLAKWESNNLDLADLDQDGDDDFLSVGQGVYWYENIDDGQSPST